MRTGASNHFTDCEQKPREDVADGPKALGSMMRLWACHISPLELDSMGGRGVSSLLI